MDNLRKRRVVGARASTTRLRSKASSRGVTGHLLVVALLSSLLVATSPSPVSASTTDGPTLWITDAGRGWVYQVTTEGALLNEPFRPPNTGVNGRRAISSVAVDPTDLTLWGSVDGTGTTEDQGRLLNYSRSGERLDVIEASSFGAFGTEGIALTVSPVDNSLWVVDDPIEPGFLPTVYNVSRSGDLLSSFPTADFDTGAVSPQAIAYDPYSQTLWITDNRAERVYNVSQTGSLLSSFSTIGSLGTFNIQGISVESSEVLWVTERQNDRIFRLTKSGTVLSSFSMMDVDPQTDRPVDQRRWDPTGVAFDRPPGYLGAAASYGVLALPGSKLKIKDGDVYSGVVADVGLGPDAEQEFDAGLLTGTFFVDPAADNSRSHSVAISGGTRSRDLGLAASDGAYAALAASALEPTQVLGEVKDSTVITGGPGLNIVEVAKIELDDGDRLELRGNSSTFIVNVVGKLRLKGASSIVLTGDATPSHVLFNLEGSDDHSIEEGSLATGTFAAPIGKLKVKGAGSTVVGMVIGGDEIAFEDGGRLRAPASVLPIGDLGTAGSTAILGLPGSKVKLKDPASTIVGHAALGPIAEQEFDEGRIEGTLIVDPAADNSRVNQVEITGGTVIEQVSTVVADAVDASNGFSRLTPDAQYGEIKESTVIAVGGGLTVVAADKVELDGEVLEINGDSSARVILNIGDRLKLQGGSSVVLTGGVLAENVVFNVRGGGDSAVEEGSSLQGTILALYAGKLKIKDEATTVFGAVVGGGELIVEKSAVVTGV